MHLRLLWLFQLWKQYSPHAENYIVVMSLFAPIFYSELNFSRFIVVDIEMDITPYHLPESQFPASCHRFPNSTMFLEIVACYDARNILVSEKKILKSFF